MKIKNLLLTALTLTMVLASDSQGYVNLCSGFKEEQQRTADYFASLLNFDLLKYDEIETQMVLRGRKGTDPSFLIINATIDALNIGRNPGHRPSIQEVRQELNRQTLKRLAEYRPDDVTDKRLDYLSIDVVKKILESIENHEVVSTDAIEKYDQDGTDIGFCFGRGCYVDMMLTHIGVDRDSIKKIWAVGSMESGGSYWQFHIGTMVRLNDNRWVTIDNVVNRVVDAETWYQNFLSENRNKDLRVFVTDGDKFTPSLGKYDPIQMGLNLNRRNDWYKGYFQDLLAWFRARTREDLEDFVGIKFPAKPKPIEANDADSALAKEKSHERRSTVIAREYGTNTFVVAPLDADGNGGKVSTGTKIKDKINSWWKKIWRF
jgi:hypothetical protein